MIFEDPSLLLTSISTMIVSEIEDALEISHQINKTPEIYCFNEEKYIEENLHQFSAKKKALLRSIPTNKAVLEFLESLKLSVEATEEEVLCGYIYINRILDNPNNELTPTNWRKVIRDCDYEDINKFFYETYSFCSLKEIGDLEINFIKNIDFKLFISKKCFTKIKIELETYSSQIKKRQTLDEIPSIKFIKNNEFECNWKNICNEI